MRGHTYGSQSDIPFATGQSSSLKGPPLAWQIDPAYEPFLLHRVPHHTDGHILGVSAQAQAQAQVRIKEVDFAYV